MRLLVNDNIWGPICSQFDVPLGPDQFGAGGPGAMSWKRLSGQLLVMQTITERKSELLQALGELLGSSRSALLSSGSGRSVDRPNALSPPHWDRR